MTYTIQAIYPSTEDGFVYADVLINDEQEPRRLILPADTAEAKTAMENYLLSEQATEPVVEAPVVELIDQTVIVEA